MNLMGMGVAEIAVVMVVAFLVLGPNRAINLARTAGKLLGDLRRTFNDVAAAMTLEEKEQSERTQAGATQAGPPQAGTQWESRPVDQEQSHADETTQEDAGPEDIVPEDAGDQAQAKNGDE